MLLQTISATRTGSGLNVKALLDHNDYPTGRKLTRAQRKAVAQRVARDEFHGEWNYSLAPTDSDRPVLAEQGHQPTPIPVEATFLLTHPALTGMTREQFDHLVLRLEPCRQILAEAERQAAGRDRRGRNPGFGILDHGHRILAAMLSSRNTVALTLVARLLVHDRNTLSYHAGRTRPLLAFVGADLVATLTRQTHPPRPRRPQCRDRTARQHD